MGVAILRWIQMCRGRRQRVDDVYRGLSEVWAALKLPFQSRERIGKGGDARFGTPLAAVRVGVETS